jgi:hypothetical protein
MRSPLRAVLDSDDSDSDGQLVARAATHGGRGGTRRRRRSGSQRSGERSSRRRSNAPARPAAGATSAHELPDSLPDSLPEDDGVVPDADLSEVSMHSDSSHERTTGAFLQPLTPSLLA